MNRQEALAILKDHGHRLPEGRKEIARKFYIMENNGQDFSEKQEKFFTDLALEAAGKHCAEVFTAQQKAYPAISDLMIDHPSLRKPRITFGNIRLVIAGTRSRYQGDISIYGREQGGKFYGRIAKGGQFFPSQRSSNVITDQLDELDADPTALALKHGKATGSCCFCSRELTDDLPGHSIERGYGPTCAGHYGLPWGSPDEEEQASRHAQLEESS